MKPYPRYSNLQIMIHWMTVILVLVTFSLPFIKDLFSEQSSRRLVTTFHMSFGSMVFILTAIRIIVVKIQGVPDVIDVSKKLQKIAAKSVQGIIYLFLLLLPLTGYFRLRNGVGFDFLNLVHVPTPVLSSAFHASMRSIHNFTAYALLVLIGLHALAALYHHYYAKDNVLKSMLLGQNRK